MWPCSSAARSQPGRSRWWWKYDHLDAVGSVRAVTNQSGQVVRRHDYFPFGDGSDGTTRGQDTLRYTGKERDPESGLDYFGARYYASRVGRFTTPDEPENDFDLTTPQSLNRYVYARNNPLRYTDPDGRAIESAWDVFNVAMGIGSMVSNIRARNWGSAAVDFGGTLLDAGATVVPFLPGGASTAIRAKRAASKVDDILEVAISHRKSPKAAKHIDDAQAAGHPDVVTLDRSRARPNRRDSLAGTKPQRGMDRDEYPPACCTQGGAGASVRPIPRGDNRSAGGQLGRQIDGVPDGTRVRITTRDKPR